MVRQRIDVETYNGTNGAHHTSLTRFASLTLQKVKKCYQIV